MPIHLHRTPTALRKHSSIASAFLILALAPVRAALAAALQLQLQQHPVTRKNRSEEREGEAEH